MKRIFVAGHNGMVGAALTRELGRCKENIIITASKTELDLTEQGDVRRFFQKNQIDEVYLAAAKVGGILANSRYPAHFLYENLMIQNNVIDSAYQSKIKRLLFLGSSCIYPKQAPQPIKESYLLSDFLEPTNEPYAIAKIAGLKMCAAYNKQFGTNFRSVMPTNLYGPGDNYHAQNSHVIPGLIRRFHDAKVKGEDVVEVWGSGEPLRDFLYVEDLAHACKTIMDLSDSEFDGLCDPGCEFLNVASGHEVKIAHLAELIAKTVGYKGAISFDSEKPDGTLRKALDLSKIKSLGWIPRTSLKHGLKMAYRSFLASKF